MTDFYQKLVDMQGTVEDLVRKVPVVGTAFEKQDLREADTVLREHIAGEYEQLLSDFSATQSKLADRDGLKYLEQAQTVTILLQTFIDRVRTAARGYSGLFDWNKVTVESLQNVYAFDDGLLVYRGQFAEGLAELQMSVNSGEIVGSEVVRILDGLEAIMREATATFKSRVDVIQSMQNSE